VSGESSGPPEDLWSLPQSQGGCQVREGRKVLGKMAEDLSVTS